jgi:hypothetical protein
MLGAPTPSPCPDQLEGVGVGVRCPTKSKTLGCALSTLPRQVQSSPGFGVEVPCILA